MMQTCVSELTTIGSDNGLSPGSRQGLIGTNAKILFIGPIGTNLSEFLIKSYICFFRKMQLKMSSGKWCPFCLSLNVLMMYRCMKWSNGKLLLHYCNAILLLCDILYKGIHIAIWFTQTDPQIAKFMGQTWGPPGSCQPQMGPMLAPQTLLPGEVPW